MMTPEQRRLKQRLAKTRDADARHDAKMRKMLKGSGITLEECRAAGGNSLQKDAFMLAAFAAARRARGKDA